MAQMLEVCRRASMVRRVTLGLASVLGGLLLAVGHVQAAESGATLTPDRAAYLVNKDIGSDRWTIGLNAVPGDPNRFVNVTGNVFRSDGSPPAFVVCQVNRDSIGSLADPASSFSFTCRGADACQSDATQCAVTSWTLISEDVQLPASFFLPPGGLGGVVASTAKHARCSGASCLAAFLFDAASSTRDRMLRSLRLVAQPAEAVAQGVDRGATLSFDRFTYLVNKDIQNERWSISLNAVPVETEQGTVTRIQSVTGNVFKRDGSEPSFVYCTERPDSEGTLSDSASQFRLSCSGASSCVGSAVECADQSWTLINDDISLPASFFLPPGGLPAPAQSDPEIVVIGRTSDPSSVATKDYRVPEGASSTTGVLGQGCAVGSTCLASRIGSCADVAGELVEIAGFGCACQVDDVPRSCITCGGGASGQCGGSCEFSVGQFAARGECLPASSDSGECACYAVPAEQEPSVRGCSGPLDATCESGRCCADDPRDGCDLASGDVACSGICVPSSCGAGEACGICESAQQGAVCPNGVREGNEQCDGSDVPSGCLALGLGAGSLRCTTDCRFDTSGCGPRPTGSPIFPPTPSPTGATPQPTEPTPRPSVTTPVPSGPTPGPTGPTPGPTGPTPGPTGPTPGPTGPTPSPQGEPCPYVLESSDPSGLDVVINVGAQSGSLTLVYEPFGDPSIGGNSFTVETLDGATIFSSGCVFDPGPGNYPPLVDSFSYSGGPSLRLRVGTFCNGGAGVDLWSVNLSCGQ